MRENWWDAFARADETDPESVQECLLAITRSVDYYQQQIIELLNKVPDIDKPIFIAAAQMTVEAVKGTDKNLGEVADAVLDLPIRTVCANIGKSGAKGGRADGEI